jgi:hypothetical protein
VAFDEQRVDAEVAQDQRSAEPAGPAADDEDVHRMIRGAHGPHSTVPHRPRQWASRQEHRGVVGPRHSGAEVAASSLGAYLPGRAAAALGR